MKTEWIYQNNPSNRDRYSLGKKGRPMLACVGLNPSTASPLQLDPTIRSIERIVQSNHYKGWIMFNLYSQRTTDPNKLNRRLNRDRHHKNLGVIQEELKNYQIDTVCLAYGDLIEKRPYLKRCLKDLVEEIDSNEIQWKSIGLPTKKGHPKHPLYQAANSKLIDFPIESYLENL